MKSRILRRDTAIRDLDEQATYIQRDSPEAAIRFLSSAESSFQLLAKSPELGERQTFTRPELAELRVWQVKGFENHLIFYRHIDGVVEVVRVLHASRDAEAAFDDCAE